MRKQHKWFAVTCSYSALLGLSIFSAGPILWMIAISFHVDRNSIGKPPAAWSIFSNYHSIFSQQNFERAVLNSVAVEVIALSCCVIFGSLCAYSLSRSENAVARYPLFSMLLLKMIPPTLLVAPVYAMLRNVGLIDSRTGLSLSYLSFILPVFIWLAKGFIDEVPRELDDAARIDGANRMRALIYVILPIAGEGLLSTTFFVAVMVWNEFLFAMMLTTSTGAQTWPVSLQLLIGEFQLPWEKLAAAGTISILPVSLFVYCFRSFLIDRAR